MVGFIAPQVILNTTGLFAQGNARFGAVRFTGGVRQEYHSGAIGPELADRGLLGVVGQEDWGAMWSAVQRAYPKGELQSIGPYDRHDSSYFVRTAILLDADGETFEVYVNPGTSEVTARAPDTPFHAFMRGLHYYLFAPGDLPFYLVCSLGIVLAGSLVTGLMAYKKFWRTFFRMPRWRAPARVLAGDLHRLAGLWSIPFVTIISATCIWYIVERAGVDFETPPPALEADEVPVPDGAAVSRWVETARREMPGLEVSGVSLPYETGEPASVQGVWQANLVRERANMVYFDPATGAVVGKLVAHDMAAGERWVHTADPLHFGNFGGLATKLLWFVFGLMLTGMAFTGAFIFARRTGAAISDDRLLPSLFFLKHLKRASIALITLVPTVSFLFFWSY